jgi:hypothetical protein
MRLRPLCALLVVVSAGACTSWHQQSAPTPQAVATNSSRELRVTGRDHAVYLIRNATVVGDSIVGTTGSPGTRVAVATADVQRIDARKVSGVRTGALTVGAIVLVSVIAIGAAMAAFLGDWN